MHTTCVSVTVFLFIYYLCLKIKKIFQQMYLCFAKNMKLLWYYCHQTLRKVECPMMTSRAEWRRPCFIPEGLTVVPPPCAKNRPAERSTLLRDRGILLNQLDLLQNKQELWSWGFSFTSLLFTLLFHLACGLKSLLTAASLFFCC